MTDQPNPPAIPQDNLFGICARLGEDFGFNPLWLRMAFGAALVFAPVAVIAGYFALGAVVLTSRLLFPPRRASKVMALPIAPAVREPAATTSLPLAA